MLNDCSGNCTDCIIVAKTCYVVDSSVALSLDTLRLCLAVPSSSALYTPARECQKLVVTHNDLGTIATGGIRGGAWRSALKLVAVVAIFLQVVYRRFRFQLRESYRVQCKEQPCCCFIYSWSKHQLHPQWYTDWLWASWPNHISMWYYCGWIYTSWMWLAWVVLASHKASQGSTRDCCELSDSCPAGSVPHVRITKYACVSTTHCACIVLTLNLTPLPC